MLRRTLIILTLTVIAGCGGSPQAPGPVPGPGDTGTPPPPPAPPTLKISRMLSFGDSMTAGTTTSAALRIGVTPGLPESYPFRLQTMLASRYTAQTVSVSNAGQPSEHLRDAGTRTRFAREFSAAAPQLVILMEGANDLNDVPGTSTNVSAIVGAMEDLVRDALGRGAQVMVATLPPQRPGLRLTARAALVGPYNDQLRAMAARKGATLVDVSARMTLSSIGPDGLHPTAAGYDLLAQIFMDAIRAVYETPAGTSSAAAARPARP